MNERVFVRIVIRVVALLASIVPPLVCTMQYFPVWRERGGTTLLSGITLLLLLLCAVPMFKYVRKVLASPSAHTIWFIIFVAFFMLSRIADEMTVISFTGFISNVVGAILFKVADSMGERKCK